MQKFDQIKKAIEQAYCECFEGKIVCVNKSQGNFYLYNEQHKAWEHKTKNDIMWHFMNSRDTVAEYCDNKADELLDDMSIHEDEKDKMVVFYRDTAEHCRKGYIFSKAYWGLAMMSVVVAKFYDRKFVPDVILKRGHPYVYRDDNGDFKLNTE